jgi:GGDEF domain-containing protein
MPEAPFGARRPHPVADVPPAVLADGQVPAKGWLLALVAARPLSDVPAVPTAELAREAPALCAAILRAVGSDAELARLQAAGDLAPLAASAGALAGAGSPPTCVAAIGRLRAALWDALMATMPSPDAATTAALATRVAFVCDVVAIAAVAAGRRAAAPPVTEPVGGEPAGTGPAGTEPAGAGPAGAAPVVTEPAGAEPRLHDARGDWRTAVERHISGGRAFALLAVDVDDRHRLLAADRDGSAAAAFARVEDAVRAELRPGDVMGRDEDGRLWVVAAELGTTGGRALGERLADAVAAAATLHGAPLSASIGLAAHPADGADAVALVGHADEAAFAARAAGVPIA